jgi:hypothetical protein
MSKIGATREIRRFSGIRATPGQPVPSSSLAYFDEFFRQADFTPDGGAETKTPPWRSWWVWFVATNQVFICRRGADDSGSEAGFFCLHLLHFGANFLLKRAGRVTAD